ncbi:GAF domain-containing protein [Bradyrhizobium sp. CB82]|uniref:GAF domain-containing protein n=1 Tax=Bradyrhizobium sp. CB82 TaxID=3039159 RepID=UPI0024B10957|nr:GAF domain-containing protein [Bradyrhizobium sp. CB82]WFU39139.1 GAF domain-containing protein [Bradyrhizobium sp. CB82]
MVHPIEIPYHIVQKWQEMMDLVGEIMHVPSALIMKVESPNIRVFVASESEKNPWKRDEVAPLSGGTYCEAVMATRQMLLVPDALQDDEWKSNPDIELGMISYLGLPITWPDGEIFGTVCVLDSKRNEHSEVHSRLLLHCRDVSQADLRSLVTIHELEQSRSEDPALGRH